MKLLGSLICYNLIPLAMLVFGYKYRFKTPKRGNGFGYISKAAMKNMLPGYTQIGYSGLFG